MKKKLLFALVLSVVLVCLFAICASAEVITYNDGTAPVREKYLMKNDEVVEFYDGNVFPVYYVFKDVSTVSRDYTNSGFSFDEHFDFSYVDGKLGHTEEDGNLYTFEDVKGFDIPSGIKSVGIYAGRSMTTLKWITFPNTITSLDNAIFQSASGLEYCEMKFADDNTMRKFPTYMFYGCTSLKAFSMPDCFTSIESPVTFYNCSSMTAVYLSNNLTHWYTQGGGTGATFDGCKKMYFVNESFTRDNIPEKPEVYYFPESLTSTDASLDFSAASAMRNCNALNDVMVFGTNVTKMSNPYFFQNIGKCKIVFLGDMTEVATGYWGNATHIYFANPADKSTDDVKYSGKTTVFCNAEGNTTHLYKVAVNKAPTCTEPGVNGTACFCGKPNPDSPSIPATHDYGKELSYNVWAWTNNNYFANANYKHICQVCEEEYIGEEIADSHLFVKEGYSSFANKNGEETTSYDVQFSIKVNQEAMDEYTNQTGKTVRYGTVAGVGNSLENPLSYAENELSVGASAVMSEMTGTDYVKLIIKIVKIPVTDKPVSVSCNAFAIVDSKLKYVSDGTVNETAEPKTV